MSTWSQMIAILGPRTQANSIAPKKYSRRLIIAARDPRSLWVDFTETDWVGDLDERSSKIKKFFENKCGIEYLGHGRHRIVFALSDSSVLKVPLNYGGVKANKSEFYQRFGQPHLLKCRLFGLSLVMTRVTTIRDVLFGNSSLMRDGTEVKEEAIKQDVYLPKWVFSFDEAQVGYHPITGRLVAYDYGE